MNIAENYQNIQTKIAEACIRGGRSPHEVKLIVVTKNQPAWKINQVIQSGARRLGENYPEQLAQKIAEIDQTKKPEWHMIGHLQSRKIKYIIEYFSMMHSIEDLNTAEKLNRACTAAGIRMPICIEVNIAGETSKFGIDASEKEKWGSIAEFVLKIGEMDQLIPVGLMTMPPYVEQGELNRKYFQKCRLLLEYIKQETHLPDFLELSMGTSSDFETAIEEGATFVRIGEAIMGSREN